MANPTRRELVDLWRFHTGERSPEVVTDRDIWPLLQGGLEAFNNECPYYETDNTDTTLVAETQEYDLPADHNLTRWVRWNGRFLEETDTERLRGRGVDWLSGASGEPAEYYLQGRKIGFYPKPSAAAVAAAATVTIHQVATPADIGTNATIAQLSTMHRRIPVYHAVSVWFAGLGADAERAGAFLALFNVGAAAARAAYAERKQQK